MATVRFFAAAADIIGSSELTFDVANVSELRSAILSQFGQSAVSIISRCSILVSGSRAENDAQLIRESDTVDILPPFAGG